MQHQKSAVPYIIILVIISIAIPIADYQMKDAFNVEIDLKSDREIQTKRNVLEEHAYQQSVMRLYPIK